MRIGVVSDTHSLEIPRQLLDDFRNTDLIIHVGDICRAGDLEILKGLARVEAVWGNMDGEDLRRLLPRRKIIHLEGVAVGLTHGHGARRDILDMVRDEFKKDKVDAVVFGHSHQPHNEVIEGVLFFNPGSPNDSVSAPYRSYGILEITSGKISGTIVKIKSSHG
jgi:putative phosphoesterase